MPGPWIFVIIGFCVAAIVVSMLWRPLQVAARESRLVQARKEFHKQREWLEVKFITVAKSPTSPAEQSESSPHWVNCDFDDAVSYVRHRSTGDLSAFVGVTVALEGFDHVGVTASELMNNVRAGTAVFRFDKNRWVTDGRVILNLSPAEAIRFYQNDLEIVGQELADRPA
jgi:hypothetical protein